MKRLTAGWLLMMVLLINDGCISQDKTYYVVFEGKPMITDSKVWYSEQMEIGRVLEQKPTNEVFIAEISIFQKHNDLMKDNVVFYVANGKLIYETIAESGKPLEKGAKILGFTGKTSLLMFQAKSVLKNLSDAAVSKALELYNKTAK